MIKDTWENNENGTANKKEMTVLKEHPTPIKEDVSFDTERFREVIQIKWDGPFCIEDLKSLNNGEIDYGIYQIYGDHLVYGQNVLLYIGQANEQTFYTRITQHAYWLEKHFSFYVGRLSGQLTPTHEIWHDKISAAEQLLINIHAPAYNTANINSVNVDKVGHLHIMNVGEYKSLLPEVSGTRWLREAEMLAEDVYKYKKE